MLYWFPFPTYALGRSETPITLTLTDATFFFIGPQMAPAVLSKIRGFCSHHQYICVLEVNVWLFQPNLWTCNDQC
jgi:hypothetical protein